MTYASTECAICLEELAPSNGNQQSAVAASCRLACGHVFHHDCVLQCYGSRLTQCPLCRVEFLPTGCGFCGVSLYPSAPVSTLSCCGTQMHWLYLDSWLLGSGDDRMGCSLCRGQREYMLADKALLQDSPSTTNVIEEGNSSSSSWIPQSITTRRHYRHSSSISDDSDDEYYLPPLSDLWRSESEELCSKSSKLMTLSSTMTTMPATATMTM